MKILFFSLLLLCLSGTYGMSIPQQDEAPNPKPSVKESLKNVFLDAFVFCAELVSTWDSSEAEREAVLGKRAEELKRSYLKFALNLFASWTETYMEAAKEFNETYPVYYNKAHPALQNFVMSAFKNVLSAIEEIKPYFDRFEEHAKKQQFAFWEEVRPIIISKAKPMLDSLNASLKPYIGDVRKEVAAAKAKEDSKPAKPSEHEPLFAEMEEGIKQGEFMQKIAMFNKDVWKKILDELEFFHTEE